jgi:hypothetical protein
VHGVHHALQGRIEEVLGGFRVEVADQLGGAFEVGKEHGDLFAFACQGGTGGEDFLGEIRRGVGEGGTRLVDGRGRSWRRGRTDSSRPDQATAVVIDHVWVGVEEFVLQVLEDVIIEIELPFEGAISHAASTLQHRHRLIKNLLEGHGRPSTKLALVPRERNVRQGGIAMERAA